MADVAAAEFELSRLFGPFKCEQCLGFAARRHEVGGRPRSYAMWSLFAALRARPRIWGRRLADNKLAENAGWDQELLALELNYIAELDIDFDLTITGFETAEIDLLMSVPDTTGGGEDADEVCTIDRAQPAVSRPGDLWILGRHRLLCGDATREDSFKHLLDGHRRK